MMVESFIACAKRRARKGEAKGAGGIARTDSVDYSTASIDSEAFMGIVLEMQRAAGVEVAKETVNREVDAIFSGIVRKKHRSLLRDGEVHFAFNEPTHRLLRRVPLSCFALLFCTLPIEIDPTRPCRGVSAVAEEPGGWICRCSFSRDRA